MIQIFQRMGEFFVVLYMLFSCDLDWLSFEIEKCLDVFEGAQFWLKDYLYPP